MQEYLNFVVQNDIMTYIRKPLIGIPIRFKTIKGKQYAYQRVRAWRDPDTGKVQVQDRHLGAVKPARPKPVLDQLDKTDVEIIAAAWQRGEGMDWIRTYLKSVIADVPEPNTIYMWLRAQDIKRKDRTTKRAEKHASVAAMRVERIKRLKAEEKGIKARQAKRRVAAQKEMVKGKSS